MTTKKNEYTIKLILPEVYGTYISSPFTAEELAKFHELLKTKPGSIRMNLSDGKHIILSSELIQKTLFIIEKIKI